jgi:hypothetical protein
MSQTQTEVTQVASRAAAKSKSARRSPKVRKHNIHAASPVLDDALLARTQQLNLDYLELLVAEHAGSEGAAQLQHLPPTQRAALAALPASALTSLAAAPYTLYSLGVEDENFWASICAGATKGASSSVMERYARAADTSTQHEFCKVALLHAWHVAATNPMAARVVYAMPYITAQRLAATSLWQITRIAASHTTLLMPRWPTNPAFWPDLIRFAATNDVRRLTTTRLLGVQLVAAELEVACAMSRRDPRAAALASPRLRARKLQMEPRPR